MEIAPIAGVRILPVTKARPVDPELAPSYDVDAAVRLDEDTYSPNGRKAAGAEEPEEEIDEPEDMDDDEFGWQPRPRHPESNRRSKFSFFA